MQGHTAVGIAATVLAARAAERLQVRGQGVGRCRFLPAVLTEYVRPLIKVRLRWFDVIVPNERYD
ncbi:hypothetical protein [Streptomyces brasiliensis]|uniref:Uncharacterized protein n=1 Tax=Streptomyces brasiliensis TaxID=1954 RepID=A0A917KZ26_9ACTN|nr:hypothetical protein [Streptomyces brasiliensis]GGJ34624.1 hypothetical protein GCM10010121_052320 [Streptomyces brasiliensis]